MSEARTDTLDITELRYLLSSEVVGNKVLLQLFIGIVDTQLLQVVDLEALKSIHI